MPFSHLGLALRVGGDRLRLLGNLAHLRLLLAHAHLDLVSLRLVPRHLLQKLGRVFGRLREHGREGDDFVHKQWALGVVLQKACAQLAELEIEGSLLSDATREGDLAHLLSQVLRGLREHGTCSVAADAGNTLQLPDCHAHFAARWVSLVDSIVLSSQRKLAALALVGVVVPTLFQMHITAECAHR